MKSFILMLTFLTRIPWPIRFDFEEDTFAKGLLYLPVIGAIIGLPLYLLARYMPFEQAYLRSFLLILLYLVIAGGLHLDGLADYFDGIFSGRSRERILEIMKDSSIGTFGVVGICLYFLGMFVGLMEVMPLAVLLMPIIARTVGVLICAFGHYPKEAGMGQPMIVYGRWYHGIGMVVLLLPILFLAGKVYLISGVMTLILMMVFHLRTTQIIGGVTGDVIGVAIELSQVVWLLSMLVLGGL